MHSSLTQSEAIETYTPYDVTSSRPQKNDNCIFCQLWRDRKNILRAGPELKFENCESVQHRFSGIKKGAKISFHRYFKTDATDVKKWVKIVAMQQNSATLIYYPPLATSTSLNS